MDDFTKYKRLLEYLRDHKGGRVLIFVETKKGADHLTRSLCNDCLQAVAIHGDKSQDERDRVLAGFKAGRHQILVATDVAARGLDVKDIQMVINFDFPNNCEDYVHRIGRCGRAGAKGTAVSFITQNHARCARELVKILLDSGNEVPRQLQGLESFGGGGGGRSRGGYRR